MISKRELEDAIRRLESDPVSYQNCEKLATFYTIYEHLRKEEMAQSDEPMDIPEHGDSEFLQIIRDKDPELVWSLLDELMDALSITNPRLYDGFMRKIDGQI